MPLTCVRGHDGVSFENADIMFKYRK